MKVYGYTHVSTDQQARVGVSLGMHADRIRAYAAPRPREDLSGWTKTVSRDRRNTGAPEGPTDRPRVFSCDHYHRVQHQDSLEELMMEPHRDNGNTGLSERLVTVKELADLLGVSCRWIHERTRRHEIPCYRFGTAVRFSPQEIQAWLTQYRQMPRNGGGKGG